MEQNYKNIIPHVDIDRSSDGVEFLGFDGFENVKFAEFNDDVEVNNDSIELHLIKSRSYKEALILKLKRVEFSDAWQGILKDEQKTFGGSKIFYMNHDCSKLLVLGVPNEIKNKLNMVIARINKANDRISRINLKIKKENIDLYSQRIKDKASNKLKEEILNFINQNLRA